MRVDELLVSDKYKWSETKRKIIKRAQQDKKSSSFLYIIQVIQVKKKTIHIII